MTNSSEIAFKHLQQCVPIKSLDNDAFLLLQEKVEFKSYQAGQAIFSIGDTEKLSFYLLQGQIQLISKDKQKSIISAENKPYFFPIANLKPRLYNAHAITDQTILASIDSDFLDELISSNNSTEVNSLFNARPIASSLEDEDDSLWKLSLMKKPLFSSLSSEVVNSLFEMMEPCIVKSGQKIIKQYDVGDYYYMIKSGRCQVTQFLNDQHSDESVIFELSSTDSFGEEALLSGNPRNASITMLSDGLLMRLNKDDFRAFLEKPLLKWISYEHALSLIELEAATCIDVREESDYEHSHIEGAHNIPHSTLRTVMHNLDKEVIYIVYSNTGTRSSASAFLLTQADFNNVFIIQGGYTHAEI